MFRVVEEVGESQKMMLSKHLPKVDLKAIVKDRNIESKKLSMLRRKVAQRLVAVKNQTAMLNYF